MQVQSMDDKEEAEFMLSTRSYPFKISIWLCRLRFARQKRYLIPEWLLVESL